VSWREEFGRKFIFRQICKMTLKKRVQEQKRGKEKNTLFPEILKTTRFLEKTCKQDPTEQTRGNCYGLDPG